MGGRTRLLGLGGARFIAGLLAAPAGLALPAAAADAPPKGDLLEFIALWGEAAPLLDDAADSGVADDHSDTAQPARETTTHEND